MPAKYTHENVPAVVFRSVPFKRGRKSEEANVTAVLQLVNPTYAGFMTKTGNSIWEDSRQKSSRSFLQYRA